jgi:hypothetical protein
VANNVIVYTTRMHPRTRGKRSKHNESQILSTWFCECVSAHGRWRREGDTDQILCRACMHSFFIDCQFLRELRITSVLIITAIQKEMWVGFKCNGPVNFFPERRYFKHNTCVFPPCPPPPPHQASSPLLGNLPPPPPKAPLL